MGHQQLLGRRRRRKEGCCLLCVPCPGNAQALCVELLKTATSWPYSPLLSSLCPFSRPKGRQRKLWKDEGRWEHDKFREDEQAPKTRQELIALYGYDIRSAHNPDDIKPRRMRKPR